MQNKRVGNISEIKGGNTYALLSKLESKITFLDEKDVVKHEQLVRNTFSSTWKGLWKGKEVFIREHNIKKRSKEEFFDQARIMHMLHHENVLKIHGVILSTPICIITEHISCGDLKSYIKEHKSLTDVQLFTFAIQVASAMIHLEQHKVIYGNLQATNVLLDDTGTCKLAGFDVALHASSEKCNVSNVNFPIRWSAPEVICGIICSKSDVWSYGILLTEIFSQGDQPFSGCTCNAVLSIIQRAKRGIKITKDLFPNPLQPFSDMLYDLMLKCWKTEPDERPTFEFIKIHLEDFKFVIEECGEEAFQFGKTILVEVENVSNHLIRDQLLYQAKPKTELGVNLEDIKLDKDDVTLNKEIGIGYFANVYKANTVQQELPDARQGTRNNKPTATREHEESLKQVRETSRQLKNTNNKAIGLGMNNTESVKS
nr:tyrosine-protein kinase SRK3-like [Ciona intestinalis]|eukprot:XP_026689465.1 tyrosine-protein kinase SRK3-like [Ciona intestinalis]